MQLRRSQTGQRVGQKKTPGLSGAHGFYCGFPLPVHALLSNLYDAAGQRSCSSTMWRDIMRGERGRQPPKRCELCPEVQFFCIFISPNDDLATQPQKIPAKFAPAAGFGPWWMRLGRVLAPLALCAGVKVPARCLAARRVPSHSGSGLRSMKCPACV